VTALCTTPAWLLESEPGLCPCGCAGRRRKGNFVEKTVRASANVLRQALFSDGIATERGLLQRLDPRVKLVALLGLLLTTALARSFGVLAGLYVVTLGLASASALSLSFFVKRVWLFVPVFTALIALPATSSFVTPGHVVASLGPLAVTSQGLHAAGLLVARVATSISIVVLLTVTTPWSKLLAALRALFVPRVFVLVLGMTYRYLFTLLGTVTDMYTARTARTVTRDSDVTRGRAFVAASAGALFGKSNALADEVHMAMTARGYTGDVRTLTAMRTRSIDWIFAAAVFVVAVGAIGVNRVVG
jgi:cobalt ECF transporter T component CbiQ